MCKAFRFVLPCSTNLKLLNLKACCVDISFSGGMLTSWLQVCNLEILACNSNIQAWSKAIGKQGVLANNFQACEYLL